MITFDVESMVEMREEITPLFIKHKDEVAVYDFFELDPDWDTYKFYEDAGKYVHFTARDEDGTLVGYVSYAVTNSLHYKAEIYATMDLIYLHEDYRHTGIAEDMMEFAENYLKENYGVTMLTIHMKTRAPFETLALSLDYDKMEYLYTKYVGD